MLGFFAAVAQMAQKSDEGVEAMRKAHGFLTLNFLPPQEIGWSLTK